MDENDVFAIIRRAETSYIRGSNVIGRYVTWSMHDTLETIDAYLNSKHTSGLTDSLGREKPFFNIVTSARNIWFRATDLDRKDIKFVPKQTSSVVLTFIANFLLQQWMDDNDFGTWLNKWGLALASYGSSVPKFVEQGDKLIPTVVPWNRLIPDAIDFDALPTIEKLYKTPAQLRRMATKGDPMYVGYDIKQVENFISEKQTARTTLDLQQKDDKPYFIELYEIHGELPVALLDKDPASIDRKDKRWNTYRQQMHVVGYVAKEGDKDEFSDFTLYKGKESKHPYKITTLLEQEGRTLGIGAVEYLFDAQWMANHTIKNMKDTLDLASKIILQTTDGNFAARNALTAIETGDILITAPGTTVGQVNVNNGGIGSFGGFLALWQAMSQELTSTPPVMRGAIPHSGTSFRLQGMVTQQAEQLFAVMQQNKQLQLEEIIREYVIPHIKKQLKNRKEIAAILDDIGVSEIDSLYIPAEAMRRYNERTANQMLANAKQVADGKMVGPLQPFNQDQESAPIKQGLSMLGGRRFFKPDELDEQTWADIFSEFEWENVRVSIPNENDDQQTILSTLSSVLQTIATNPTVLEDPNAKMLFGKILEETGVISPLQFVPPAPPQTPALPGGGPPAPSGGPSQGPGPLALGAPAQAPNVMAPKQHAAELIG